MNQVIFTGLLPLWLWDWIAFLILGRDFWSCVDWYVRKVLPMEANLESWMPPGRFCWIWLWRLNGRANEKLLRCYGCWHRQLNVRISIDLWFTSYLNIHIPRGNAVYCKQKWNQLRHKRLQLKFGIDRFIDWNFLIGPFKPWVGGVWDNICETWSLLKESFLKTSQRGVNNF